jgi:putative DNA primase/helicase
MLIKYLELNSDKTPITTFDVFVKDMDKIENAGLLLNPSTIVVDFDNDNVDEQKIVDHLIQHYPTQTVITTRGTHLYYKIPKGTKIKNGADKITNGGFQADFKTGKNAYTIVKLNGKVRKGGDAITLKDLPELPFVCYPLPKAKNMTGFDDGDGRNSALFYHLRLIREQLGVDHLEECADFVNSTIFKKPFDEKEMATLIDSVKKADQNSDGNYNGKPSDMISYGKFLVKELDIQIYQEQLFFKKGLHYSNGQTDLQQKANDVIDLKKAQHAELIHQLYSRGNMVDPLTPFKVKLRNGVIVQDNVIDTDIGFTPFYLDVSYDPHAHNQDVDSFLDFITMNRKDMRVVVEEIIGHVLLVEDFPHKIFFLTGSGANGKSTFLEMITKFAGKLSSHVDINNFDDGTSLTSLIGKIVNIADDVDAVYLEKSKNLKTMASGNTVGARAIYSQPITILNTASLLFTANEPPTFKDKSDGIGRRLLILPFENRVVEKTLHLRELLSSDNAKSYLLNLGLQGIGRIIANQMELSTSKTIIDATQKYHQDNDSVVAYVTENPLLENNPIGQVYKAYQQYCEDSNLRAVAKNTFIKRLKSIGFDVVTATMNKRKMSVLKKIEGSNA